MRKWLKTHFRRYLSLNRFALILNPLILFPLSLLVDALVNTSNIRPLPMRRCQADYWSPKSLKMRQRRQKKPTKNIYTVSPYEDCLNEKIYRLMSKENDKEQSQAFHREEKKIFAHHSCGLSIFQRRTGAHLFSGSHYYQFRVLAALIMASKKEI